MWGWRCVLAGVAVCVGSVAVWGQSNACSVAAPQMTSSAPDMFNDKQEQDLADAFAEYVEAHMRIATPAPDDQITRIGERLLATLPPTGIHYQFRIYESGEINGFSIGGGRVYISRKLLAAVKTEDDLAGVLAHEIGHISTHQTAIGMTRVFQKIGVTKVGDRADIFARVHQLMSDPPKGGAMKHEDVDELIADRVAIYAMVRAGYAPENFATFFDQVSQNQGKTGNWFSNAFGLTREDTKRYVQAMAFIGTLPASCKGQRAADDLAFHAWLQAALEERITDVAAGLTEEKTLKLDPPLRPTFDRVHISPDGALLLGQDSGSIVISERASGKQLFRIEAPDAKEAKFTPDSKDVVFNDENLRVERWDVATGKRISVKEVVVFSGCTETLLSPDGRTLLCVTVKEADSSLRVGVHLVDVDSGKLLFDKDDFYEPSAFDSYRLISMASNLANGYQSAITAVSNDGRYLALAAGNKSIGFDFQTQQLVPLEGKLKGLQQTRMSFVGPKELAVLGEVKKDNLYALRIFSFPDGQLLRESEIGNQFFAAATKPGSLIIWPLKTYVVGIYDVDTRKLTAASKLNSIDAWGPYALTEDVTGGFDLFEGVDGSPWRIPVDLGPLPNLNRGMFSRDGKVLAVSLSNRAALWDTETGKQIALIRPFQSGWMDEHDALFGQFPKFSALEPVEMKFNTAPLASAELGKLDDSVYQYHNLDLKLKPMGKGKGTARHTTLEVKKMEGQNVAWSHDFDEEPPAYWPAEDERLVFAWDLTANAVEDEVRAHPNLGKELAALKNARKGLLLETVNPETGAPLEQVILPEIDLTRGWNDGRRAMVSGDVVLARGEHENTTIYRLKDGSKVGEFFGHAVASDAQLHLIAAVNRENEILLVDETTGKELKRFTLNSPVRLARITGTTEKTLMVLTADQVVHRIAVP